MQNRPRSRTQNKPSILGRRRSFSKQVAKQVSNVPYNKEEYVMFNPATSVLSLTEKKSIHQRQSTINGRPNVLLLQEMEKIQN
jgi:hypothetical protein